MTDPPRKAAAILQQAEDHGLEWTEVPGFFVADRRFQIGRTDALVWIHWFPGKNGKGVGTIRASYYDGVVPQRVTAKRVSEELLAIIAAPVG